MHILFLTHYFPPEINAPASRTFEHCKHWVQKGHKVTVVTCVPNHPQGVVYPGYHNRHFQHETMAGIDVIRLWTYVTANEGFLKRTLNYLAFMAMVALSVHRFPRSDVVVSTSPQFFCGLAGYVVSRLKKIPWILEIRDLWPESILAVGAIKNKWIIKILEALERFAYVQAQRIVPVTDAFKSYMLTEGISAKKIDVIKNGVDLSLFKALPRQNRLSGDLGLNRKFVVSYFGTHGMAHGLETVLKAAERLRKQEHILFLLVGNGADKQRLLRLKDQMRLTNVMMLDQAPKQDMPYLWASSDACLVLLKKTELFKTVISSKIFEAMAMRRPIILGVEGESKAIIEQAESGLCIEPENDGHLAEAVLKLNSDSSLRDFFGDNGRQFVEKYFDRSRLAEKYLGVMHDVSSRI